MHGAWTTVDLRASLRWLGAPVTVLSLVLLAFNDFVLKEAWPGLVTGKLSDVAGLVVAPPLLAVGLTLCRVPRAGLVALASTALGFVLAKTTHTGAEYASVVWSQFGFPSLVRRDPTDLLALPALMVAAQVGERAAQPVESLRRRVGLAVGVAVLPFAVFVTAATSCSGWEHGVSGVAVVTGDFAGAPQRRERLLVVDTHADWVAIGPTGKIRALGEADTERIEAIPSYNLQACDPADPSACWRVGDDGRTVVESSSDGGLTWSVDFEFSEEESAQLKADLGERCGELAPIRTRDLAVLGTPSGPIGAVPAAYGGLLLRMPGDRWRRIGHEELVSAAEPARKGQPSGGLTVQDPAAQSEEETERPPGPSRPPLHCPSPTLATVTPNPRNGPPYVVDRCPDGSYAPRASGGHDQNRPG